MLTYITQRYMPLDLNGQPDSKDIMYTECIIGCTFVLLKDGRFGLIQNPFSHLFSRIGVARMIWDVIVYIF